MEFRISNRMKHTKGSAIRALFKLASPDTIPFGGGNPDPVTFPIEAIREISEKALKEQVNSMLLYGLSEGYTPLRNELKTYLAKKNLCNTEINEILITSGAQQAADILARCLVNEGDVVICEEPSFVGCLNSFKAMGAKLVGVPMDNDGMNMEKLEAALAENPNASFIYTIPTFQNPSGITMSLEKRKKMYELAKKFNVPIMEDNPYGELRFKGEHIPTIKSLDDVGLVIYCGSFSKIMAPSFRVGFMVMHPSLLEKAAVTKEVTDVNTNVLFQHICYEFMAKYDIEGHIKNACNIYKKKCDLMVSEIKKQFHPEVKITEPDGGMFIMGTLPNNMNADEFCKAAIEAGVVIVPGSAFLANGGASSSFRMNFASPNEEQIIKGVKILGELTKKVIS